MLKFLFTGASGFLGRHTKPILDTIYNVTTIGISDKDDINANLADSVPCLFEKYDVILHAAGKEHIYPKTEKNSKNFMM